MPYRKPPSKSEMNAFKKAQIDNQKDQKKVKKIRDAFRKKHDYYATGAKAKVEEPKKKVAPKKKKGKSITVVLDPERKFTATKHDINGVYFPKSGLPATRVGNTVTVIKHGQKVIIKKFTASYIKSLKEKDIPENLWYWRDPNPPEHEKGKATILNSRLFMEKYSTGNIVEEYIDGNFQKAIISVRRKMED
jgi:hypothetical protein